MFITHDNDVLSKFIISADPVKPVTFLHLRHEKYSVFGGILTILLAEVTVIRLLIISNLSLYSDWFWYFNFNIMLVSW